MIRGKLAVSEKELVLIKSILSKYPYTFYAFGSRVKNTHRLYSDLDLCYKDPISDTEISFLKEAFEESDLPYKVDLISWHRCDLEFQKMIEKEWVAIN